MARKKQTSKKKSAKKKGPSALETSLARVSEIVGDGRVLTAVLMALALTTVGLVGAGALESRAADLLENRNPEISFEWPRASRGGDTWLPESVRRDLHFHASEAAASEPSVFSGAQLAAIGQTLESSGWFAAPPTISRAGEGRIEIDAPWRIPAAAVRHGGRDYLVAADGGRLPLTYDEDESNLPVILGVREAPPTVRAGEGAVIDDYASVWPGEDVPRALKLLALLRGRPFSAQIAGVMVRHPEAAGGLTILTDRGGKVIWGSEPGVFKPGEMPDDKKLARLVRFHEQFDRIDLDRALIDISLPEPVEIETPAPDSTDSGIAPGETMP